MTSKLASSTKLRRQAFEHHRIWNDTMGRWEMTCHVCGLPIVPPHDQWEAEHVLPRNVRGSDDPDNVCPAHVRCHGRKSSAEATVRAKIKRVAERHFGIKRSDRPMPGSRRTAFRKHMDGSVSRRD